MWFPFPNSYLVNRGHVVFFPSKQLHSAAPTWLKTAWARGENLRCALTLRASVSP